MDSYTQIITTILGNKLRKKEMWENEYGGIHITSWFKEIYKTCDDFKVKYYTTPKNVTFFKIVPIYFSMPNSRFYWKYYDGKIIKNSIILNREEKI